ncbi:MAG: D-alanyl-D-alanine carboxypeptidase family protein [Fusobacterium sp.]
MKIYLLNMLLIFFLNLNIVAGEESKTTEKINNPQYKSYILGDGNGHVLFGENIEKKNPLASLTKMMTLLVTFDAINSGTISKTDLVPMDKDSNSLGGSRIWIKTGTKLTVEELIKATAIHSANNAAYALAKYIGGGNVDNFVKMMNEKSKQLGLDQEILYYTPTGLPPSMTGKKMDVGTAKGIYKLSEEALKYKNYIEIASQKKAEILNGKIKFNNRNKLLGKDGIYGIKTGHHDAAGFNIAIASNIDDINIIYVVLGSPNENIRDEKVEKDIKEFYNDFKYEKILNKDIPIGVSRIINGEEKFVELYPDKNIEKIYKKNGEIKLILEVNEKIKAPIKKADTLGYFKLLLNNKIIGEGKIISKNNISKRI